MIKTWFKIFFRNSKKNWLNMSINILGLTLGLAGLLIVLLFLNDEQSYNGNNANANEVYRVIHKMSDGEIWDNSTNVEGAKYQEDIPEIESFYLTGGWYDDTVVKIDDKEIYTRNIIQGNSNFFDFFPFKVTKGSSEKFKNARNHLAISEKQAKILFGTESAVGKIISFYNREFVVTTVYEIVGKHFYMPNIVFQFRKEPTGDWGSFNKSLFVKTVKGADIKEITKKANDVWYKNAIIPEAKREGLSIEEFEEKYGTEIIFDPLKDIRLKSIADSSGPEGKGNYQLILIMLSLSILLIIISCVNFINLSIASATQRAKEVGVKKTLGLSKLTITRQYALEVVLQGAFAFLFSVLLVELILPSFNGFMNTEISIVEIDVLVKVALVVILVSVVIGSIPAIYLSNFKPIEVLKGNVSKSKKGVLSRNIMLGVQFLISGFFLTGAIIINKQVSYMIHKDLGFKGEQVIIIPINKYANRFKKYELAKNELTKHSNIESITSNSFTIGGGSASSTNVDYKDILVQANANAIDFNYFDVMNIKILKGRGIEESKASDTIKNILINESLAKAFNIYDNPIGKKINIGFGGEDNDGKNLTVIGMVKDYHSRGLDRKIPPTFFMHWNSFDWMKRNFTMMQLKINPENIQETLKYIEHYWSENVEQGYPFNPTFVNKRFAKTYKKYQNQQTLFLILTSVVILVSLLGLFALATLTIQQRLKEVAIRKTLGSSVKEIMFQLIKSFLKITLIASVILIPIAYYFIQNWLENFVYRIDMPVLPFIVTPIILTILVFVIVGLKAFNATKVDLIQYLKHE